MKDANREILSALQKDSEMLVELQISFGQILESRKNEGNRMQIACFYEELPLTAVGQVVSQSSASLFGCSQAYGIPANHMVGHSRQVS